MMPTSSGLAAVFALATGACGGDPELTAPGTEPPGISVPNVGVQALWATARDDVWAAGAEGALLHFDGTAWTRVESGTTRDLLEITGSGPDDVWAVGDDVVIHYDGSSWSEVLVDMYEILITAWSGGRDELWAAGNATDVGLGVLRRWDGTDWQVAVAPGVRTLWALWGLDIGDMWTGGHGADGAPFLAHGVDGAFEQQTYPGGSPRAIWGSASDDVWIAPFDGDLHRWNGAAFESVPRAGEVPLLGLHGTAANDVWAVGGDGLILHFDGQAWQPIDSGTTATFTAIWATAADDAWIAGSDKTLLRWNGTRWGKP
jgi:hypothetical protein